MAFKVGTTTAIDNSLNLTSGVSNTTSAFPTGFYNAANNDLGSLIRYTTYTDDHNNCRGYLPTNNCNGQGAAYNVPNGNWWTWTGVTGVSSSLCGNPGGFDFAGGTSSAYYPVTVANVYDAYYELYNRIRGSEQHRGYGHCNCNSGYNSIGNCYTNCNCNCNCDCNCNC
jgi:hypothetical protein